MILKKQILNEKPHRFYGQGRQTIAWNEEQVVRLCMLHADDKSASEISGELGCTRNAVIGKIHRLGLSRVDHPNSRPKSKLDSAPHGQRAKRIVNGAKARAAHLLTIVDKPGKTIFELGLCDCRWLFGGEREPAKLFCGEQAVSGKSYCDAHCRKSYQHYRG